MNRRTFIKGLLSSAAVVPVIVQAAPKWKSYTDHFSWEVGDIAEAWQYVVRTSIPASTWRLLCEGVPIHKAPDLFPETLLEKK